MRWCEIQQRQIKIDVLANHQQKHWKSHVSNAVSLLRGNFSTLMKCNTQHLVLKGSYLLPIYKQPYYKSTRGSTSSSVKFENTAAHTLWHSSHRLCAELSCDVDMMSEHLVSLYSTSSRLICFKADVSGLSRPALRRVYATGAAGVAELSPASLPTP